MESLCVVWFHALAQIHKNIRKIMVELAWPCQIANCFGMTWDFKNLRISEIWQPGDVLSLYSASRSGAPISSTKGCGHSFDSERQLSLWTLVEVVPSGYRIPPCAPMCPHDPPHAIGFGMFWICNRQNIRKTPSCHPRIYAQSLRLCLAQQRAQSTMPGLQVVLR